MKTFYWIMLSVLTSFFGYELGFRHGDEMAQMKVYHAYQKTVECVNSLVGNHEI